MKGVDEDARRLPQAVQNAETASWIGPFNIVEFVADDPAGAAFDAALIGKKHGAILLRGVAGGGTTIDALLSYTNPADVGINDANVRSGRIDIIGVDGEFSFDGGRVEDACPLLVSGLNCHSQAPASSAAEYRAALDRFDEGSSCRQVYHSGPVIDP